MAYGLTKSAHFVRASSQYLSRADATAIRVVNGWTVEAWVKKTDAANFMSLCRSRSGENGWGIFINANGTIRPEAGSGAFDGADSTGNINDGAWHFVRVYFNGASTKIYIDGSLDSTVSIPTISNPNTTLGIGATNGGANFWAGDISLFRIWNNEHTASDSCTYYGTSTTNMQAEWSLDNVLTDSSGNGNSLTNNNTVTFTTTLPSTCSSAAYTITAAVGTYTLTGIDALFHIALIMAAALGTFVLTGINALFSLGKGLVADVGTFVLTGVDSTFHVALTFALSVGTFTLTGIDAIFNYGRVLIASTGSFILTGFAALFPWRWSGQGKNSASWSDQDKNSASWTNQNKNDQI